MKKKHLSLILFLVISTALQAQEKGRITDSILTLPEAIKNNYVESFDYPDTSIEDLVHVISKMTGKNFILDPKVRGKISIIGPTRVTVQDAYFAFLTALEMNNLTIVPVGKYLKIVTSRNAIKSPIPVYSGNYSPSTSNYITRLYPLKFINAETVRREFASLVTPAGKMIAYDPTNTLIITDTGANIQRIIKILELLDITGFEERMEVIHIEFASANEIASLIDSILESGVRDTRTSARRGRGRQAAVTAKKTTGGGVISKIIADDRTNSLIVLANDKGLLEIKKLIAKLDTGEPAAQSGNIHVYYCQYANAEELSTTLSSLISGARARPQRARTAVRGRQRQQQRAAAVQQATFAGDIKITADKPTNSLVITASREDYENLKKVLAQLDIPRNQVFVEAVFLEIEVGKGIVWDFSTNYSQDEIPRVTGFVTDPGGIGSFLSGDPATAITGLTGFVLGFTAGKKVDLTVGGKTVTVGSLQALLKFIESFDHANVLSRPTILAMDNEEASISIKDTIPTSAGTTVTGTGISQTNVRDLETGIQLQITPQINAATGYVRLKLSQSVSEPSQRAVPSGLRATSVGVSSREASTTVVVKDGDSIVIGGLIRDKEADTNQKIPLIGDIPVLGWLFKSANPTVRRSNLIMIVTPHILYGEKDVRRVRHGMMMERQQWILKNRGGRDPYREFARDIYNNESQLTRAKKLEDAHERRYKEMKRGQNVPIDEVPFEESLDFEEDLLPEESSFINPFEEEGGQDNSLKSKENTGSSFDDNMTIKEEELLNLEF